MILFDIINSASQTLIILVNWFLFLDLYLMIKNPFNGRGTIYKLYYLSLIVCLIVSVVVMYKTNILFFQLEVTQESKQALIVFLVVG